MFFSVKNNRRKARKARRQARNHVKKILKRIGHAKTISPVKANRLNTAPNYDNADNTPDVIEPEPGLPDVIEHGNVIEHGMRDFDWGKLNEENDRKTFELSDDEEENARLENEQRQETLHKNLRGWYAECNVPLSTVTKLLKILKQSQINVPSDARTLIHTPRSGTQPTRTLSGGKYIYFGIATGLMERLTDSNFETIDEIAVDLNIDGLPIFTSRNISVWPIQMSIAQITAAQKPFVVALFCGKVKPQNNDFLQDTISELLDLHRNGFKGKSFRLRFVICDAPARALVKGTKQFNGFYGCDFCEVRGERENHRMLYLEVGKLRTDTSFRNKDNKEHHKYNSAFLQLPVDMIRQFPLDVMHCVDLGVTRRLLLLWKTGGTGFNLRNAQIQRMSDIICEIRNCFPSSFNRKPRGLDELKKWKATEFRTFLLYLGPVLMKHFLDEEQYNHFLSLTIAISILSNKNLLQSYAEYADELLEYFVKKSKDLYDEQFISYNVHCLRHLGQVAREAGCLGECSAYKFENNMTTIKRSIRGSGDPLTQIANRLAEKRRLGVTANQVNNSFKIKLNGCYELKDERIVRVVSTGGNKLDVQEYTQLEPLFRTPCDSSMIGINKAYISKISMTKIHSEQIKNEAIVIPNSVFDPLSRTVSILTLNHTLDVRIQY